MNNLGLTPTEFTIKYLGINIFNSTDIGGMQVCVFQNI